MSMGQDIELILVITSAIGIAGVFRSMAEIASIYLERLGDFLSDWRYERSHKE